MFPLYRRKTPLAVPTFNECVAGFWKWFQEVAPRIYATIEDGKCSALADETSGKVDELVPGFAWVYGPGPEHKGHSLTLSGEGNEHRQLLALHWRAQAPTIAGWTFYPSRQAGPIKGHAIEMYGLHFDPKEIWVTPEIDRESKTIDVTVWHPAWERIDEQQRATVVFLYLDEALGEYGTQWWIGELRFGKDRLSGSFPLEELASYVADIVRESGWRKYPPGESYTLFNVEERDGSYPRSDIRTQLTAVPRLLNEYMDAKGEMDDPLRGTGADYVYVSIARSFFPKGGEVDKRGEVGEALDTALKGIAGGRCVGGAFGTERGYVDLLLFDGARSLAVVQQTLRTLWVPAGTMIEFFAREKRGQRIAL